MKADDGHRMNHNVCSCSNQLLQNMAACFHWLRSAEGDLAHVFLEQKQS